MKIRGLTLVILAALLVVPSTLAQAQVIGAVSDSLYQLTPDASFEEGCFPPCLCVTHHYDGLIGTFRMTPAAPDPLFEVFDITEVNWLVPRLGYRVTGKGTYRIGGEFGRMHQLQLDLEVGDRDVVHYDSGLLFGGAEFPGIAITIAMNGMICTDTVFHVRAKPALISQAKPYALIGSSYDEGCYGVCLCVVVSHPLLGRFGLLTLNETAQGGDYAVLGIDWRVRDPNSPTVIDLKKTTGYGLYRFSRTDGTQRMLLDLIEDGAGPTRFDSGTVQGGGNLQLIDIDVAANGFACFDRVYSIHAKRRGGHPVASLDPEPVPFPVAPAP
jgi:hypothetical protein